MSIGPLGELLFLFLRIFPIFQNNFCTRLLSGCGLIPGSSLEFFTITALVLFLVDDSIILKPFYRFLVFIHNVGIWISLIQMEAFIHQFSLNFRWNSSVSLAFSLNHTGIHHILQMVLSQIECFQNNLSLLSI